jgi:Tol biopolymer transport system component
VVPAAGAQGASTHATITGTGFDASTAFSFGLGVTVDDVTIDTPTRASAFVHISATATPGARTVSATRGSDGATAERPGAFTVIAPSQPGVPGTIALSLSTDQPGPLQAGEAVAYELRVTNTSTSDVGAIDVHVQLPAAVTVTGDDCAQADLDGRNLEWRLAGLDAGASAACTIDVVVDAVGTGGQLVAIAEADYTGPDGVVHLDTRAVVGTLSLPQLVTGTYDGAPTTEDSIEPSLSADGRLLVFTSFEKRLVADNRNPDGADIYLYDRGTGSMRLISRDAAGNQLTGNNHDASVSLNGMAAVFVREPGGAASMVAKGGGGSQLCGSQPNGLFQMVCTTNGSDDAPLDGDIESPTMSADGKKTAFCSSATNWVADDTNGARDVFVRDEASGDVVRVSTTADGEQGDGDSCDAMISGDGRYVVFTTTAPNLGGSDGAAQVVRKNLVDGTLIRITDAGGSPADAAATSPSISADGRRVAFVSRAGNLVPGTGNGRANLFVYDADGTAPPSRMPKDGETSQLAVMRAPNNQLPNGDSAEPKISCSGNAIAFTSSATNLVSGDTTNVADYFTYGVDSGAIVRPGANASGTESNGDSAHAALDCDATTGAYDSTQTDDTNPNPNSDIYAQGDPLRSDGGFVLDGSYSGNWYDPDQSGHGFLLEALPTDDGAFYATWYVFDDAGEPLFLQGVGVPQGNVLVVDMVSARSTGFPVGAPPTGAPWGQVTFEFGSSNDGRASWVPTAPGFTPGSMNLRRLSYAALTQSDRDGVADACNSGIWYDPDHSGYGFDLEFNDLADGRRLLQVFWYTYEPDGSPLWLAGVAEAAAGPMSFDLYRTSGPGAKFPPMFSPNALQRTLWGTATLRFTDGGLRVGYSSREAGYGDGSLSLRRLTTLRGRQCAP